MTGLTPFSLTFIFLLGVVLGSFFNAAVWRIPRRISLCERHSRCTHCRHILRFWDLIPIISYLWLGGCCRYCHKPIAWRYPAVEIVSGILPLLAVALYGWTVTALAMVALLYVLELLFLLDTSYHILPDALTIPGMAIGIAVSVLLGRTYLEILLGGILGAGVFFLQYGVSRGAWVGDGDIRLGALMGFALGWKLLCIALFISYLSGAAIGLALIALRRKGWKSHMPFGSFLTIATVLSLFWGQTLLNGYLQLLGL